MKDQALCTVQVCVAAGSWVHRYSEQSTSLELSPVSEYPPMLCLFLGDTANADSTLLVLL